jgi:hypothetical protein
MHPYTIIKNAVVEALDETWAISEESSHPEAFGSFFCVLNNGKESVRLIWDGKDGWGYAQVMKSNAWCDLPIFLTEMDIEGEPQNKEKLSAFWETSGVSSRIIAFFRNRARLCAWPDPCASSSPEPSTT